MKAVVIGAGAIAKQHLAAINASPRVELAGVCDLSPAMAEAAAERFGAAGWYVDHREMLEAAGADVAHITTPAPTHLRIATDCLEAGAHAFVEKPITPTYDDLVSLIAAADANGRWVIEDYNYQFNNDVQALQRLVADGRLGDVRHVEVRIHLGVFGAGSRFADADVPHPAIGSPLGAVSDFITHMTYLAYLFVGRGEVVGASLRRRDPSAPSYDSYVATVDGERGAATLAFDAYAQPDEFVVRVHGSEAVAETNLFERGVLINKVFGGPRPLSPIRSRFSRGFQEWGAAGKSLARKLSGGPGPYEGLWNLIHKTYDRLEAGGSPPIDVEQIRAVNRMIEDLTRRGAEACVS